MKARYFVAIKINPEIIEKLRSFYRDNFLGELPVKNLHLTLIAPFFIKEGQEESEIIKKIKEVKLCPFTAKFTGLDFFEQKGRKILYAKADPEIEFKELSERLKILIDDLIEMDIGPYTDGTVPSFKAHVTLDYDFRETIPKKIYELPFQVEEMFLFKEENGVWLTC